MADENTTEAAASTGSNKKSKLRLIIIALVAVLVLLGVGLGAMMFLGGGSSDTVAEEEIDYSTLDEAPRTRVSKDAGVMVDFATFTVNLSNQGNSRYLKIDVTAQVPSGNKEILSEIEAKMPIIKDTFITVLSSKALEEISTQQGKISLKQELLRRTNALLATGKIIDLHFTGFVIQ